MTGTRERTGSPAARRVRRRSHIGRLAHRLGSSGERGVVAGAEGLVFGTLVVLGGAVLLLNAWSVLDTRTALDSASREYLRAYTEAPDPGSAESGARLALGEVVRQRGLNVGVEVMESPDPTRFGPCAAAAVTLAARVPLLRLPFVGGLGSQEVRVRHVELVDAHREVDTGARWTREATACGR